MESFNEIKKINIVGTSGSGKSTLGKILAKEMDAKFVGLDELHWLPNWKGRSDEELFRLLEKELDCEKWVLDGNYQRTAFIKWADVDLVIWLDLPRWLNFYQAISRAIKRILSAQEIWPGTGNRETFWRTFFSKDSILLWTLRSYSNNKRRYHSIMKDPHYSHLRFMRICTRKELNEFIAHFSLHSQKKK